MLNGEVGYADGYGSTGGLPFYKNLYAGGVTSVRGFKAASLGPTIEEDGETYRIGGNRRLVANAELLWSIPGMEKSLRMGWFVDAGWVWGKGQNVELGDMRYSTGLSAAWVSPVGPLKFSLGLPLNDKDGDKVETFQFQLGTTF
jgi:outer membrane protein insertion porin family